MAFVGTVVVVIVVGTSAVPATAAAVATQLLLLSTAVVFVVAFVAVAGAAVVVDFIVFLAVAVYTGVVLLDTLPMQNISIFLKMSFHWYQYLSFFHFLLLLFLLFTRTKFMWHFNFSQIQHAPENSSICKTIPQQISHIFYQDR